jgi:hypothetical protein
MSGIMKFTIRKAGRIYSDSGSLIKKKFSIRFTGAVVP